MQVAKNKIRSRAVIQRFRLVFSTCAFYKCCNRPTVEDDVVQTDGGVDRRNCAGGTQRADEASLADCDNESIKSLSSDKDCIDDHS